MRQPIVVVLGHVDHGKTLILDRVRQSQVQEKEAGGITQHIGATEVPADYLKQFCKHMLQKLGIKIEIPGLLFVDTPGHAAFSNLRQRGGSVADLAVLVIDINAGIQPQTLESIDILKQFKVPFVIAANKIDLLEGYETKDLCFLDNLKHQDKDTLYRMDMKLYEIVGRLAELGFESERFDRVDDFAKQISIVPTSAKTGEGLTDLLAVLTGLSQKFLKTKLETGTAGRGNILEVKKEKGLGITIDVILHDGSIRAGDSIVVAGLEGPIVTKIRALLKPKPLCELRVEKCFDKIKVAHAADGIKISAPGLDNAIAGGPLVVVGKQGEKAAIDLVKKDIESIAFEDRGLGVIIRADTLGTLEALEKMLKEVNVPIRRASIGNITKKDINEAKQIKEQDLFMGVVIGFNVKNTEEQMAEQADIPVITGDIIYRIIEDYSDWKAEQEKKLREEKLSKLPRPAKFRIVPGYTFRSCKPAVVGVEVLGGVLKSHTELMKKDGGEVGTVKQLQVQGESVKQAGKGASLAVSIDGPTVGRQIKEDDVLFVSITEPEYRKLKKLLDLLSDDEREVLEEIIKIKRLNKKSWGMLEF
ncbi:MAG: translation initiation factor IF-2 [Candidatus Altiarchaeota archaeon]|nr:translation initiation factor IF-2 [Candidatus Altiarchaeota archaeon]